MSVIAWDGTTLAADRQSTNQGTLSTVRKIWPHGKELLAIVGDFSHGYLLADWYRNGADPEKYPAKVHEDSAFLTVIRREDGKPKIYRYEDSPAPLEFLDPIMAFGCGRDYALGAMSAGADAYRAVEIASEHDAYCGRGVDTLILEP